MDEINDQMLIAAARKRLLAELQGGGGGGGDMSRIVNNIYGGGSGAGGGIGSDPTGGAPSGLFDSLTGGQQTPAGEDPFDYFVDINRRDVTNDAGDKIGWDKLVHRFRGSKKKAPAHPMVQEPSYRE